MVVERGDRITLVQVLYTLLQQDEAYTEEESTFFERLLDQLEFSEDERTAATASLSAEDAEAAARALPFAMRRAQVEALIEGALVDAELEGREREMIDRIADTLGIDGETRSWLWEKMARQLDVSL